MERGTGEREKRKGLWTNSLRGRRLEVVGARKNERERGRHARGVSSRVSLLRTRSFLCLLRRLSLPTFPFPFLAIFFPKQRACSQTIIYNIFSLGVTIADRHINQRLVSLYRKTFKSNWMKKGCFDLTWQPF